MEREPEVEVKAVGRHGALLAMLIQDRGSWHSLIDGLCSRGLRRQKKKEDYFINGIFSKVGGLD